MMVAAVVVYLGAVYWFQGKQCQSALDQRVAMTGNSNLLAADQARIFWSRKIEDDIATYCTPIPRLLW